jgi:hypothetical protein
MAFDVRIVEPKVEAARFSLEEPWRIGDESTDVPETPDETPAGRRREGCARQLTANN